MQLTLPKVALIAFVATTAFTATSANALQFRTYGCDVGLFESCGILNLQDPTPGRRPVIRLDRDTSPTYMKQADPHYNSAMRDAGGGGGVTHRRVVVRIGLLHVG
ncbi:hypothetical protein, partial [Bradyrhizobium campsiandrae]|uniref:hypothetical protein n=1 Tax=Bradyrhizobium campsiandrae TaxID=1729892 RepID=UPI001FD1F1F4